MNKDWMPVAAGVMEIVAGVCAGLGAAAVAFSGAVLHHIPDVQHEEDVPLELITGLLGSLTVILALFGAAALIGGIFAIRRRGWGWALAGSIAALFVVPPLGVLSLILVLLGESEFSGHEPLPAGSSDPED
ncbi:MAG: hypothetical protein O7A98_03880 [Acidobacteria bacterium]|nr:hypothetical protein [Acidobacteriota bacterium]